MLRLALLALVLYLTSLYSSSPAKIGGGLDPDGLNAPQSPSRDIGPGWDPNGVNAPPPAATGAGGGGLDPNGLNG